MVLDDSAFSPGFYSFMRNLYARRDKGKLNRGGGSFEGRSLDVKGRGVGNWSFTRLLPPFEISLLLREARRKEGITNHHSNLIQRPGASY